MKITKEREQELINQWYKRHSGISDDSPDVSHIIEYVLKLGFVERFIYNEKHPSKGSFCHYYYSNEGIIYSILFDVYQSFEDGTHETGMGIWAGKGDHPDDYMNTNYKSSRKNRCFSYSDFERIPFIMEELKKEVQ